MVTKTGSGNIEVGRLDGSLVSKTGSGNLTVRRASAGSVRANGASGNIRIGIEEGTAAWLDVSTVSGRVSRSSARPTRPATGQQRGRDHRPHRERQPPGAPVMSRRDVRLGPALARNPITPDPATSAAHPGAGPGRPDRPLSRGSGRTAPPAR